MVRLEVPTGAVYSQATVDAMSTKHRCRKGAEMSGADGFTRGQPLGSDHGAAAPQMPPQNDMFVQQGHTVTAPSVVQAPTQGHAVPTQVVKAPPQAMPAGFEDVAEVLKRQRMLPQEEDRAPEDSGEVPLRGGLGNVSQI